MNGPARLNGANVQIMVKQFGITKLEPERSRSCKMAQNLTSRAQQCLPAVGAGLGIVLGRGMWIGDENACAHSDGH